MDHVVRKVQCDFVQRKICILDLLREHNVPVAIIASNRSGSVVTYGEPPDLKFLGGNRLVVGLNDRDFVQKPIRPTVLGNVLRAVGVENVAVDSAPIQFSLPMNCARSLLLRVFVVICLPLLLEVTPTAGAREATRPAAERAASRATVE